MPDLELEKDIYSVFEEVSLQLGDKDNKLMYLYVPSPNVEHNIYGDVMGESFLPPIHLVGLVKFFPKEKELSDLGVVHKANIIFRFSAKELKDKKVLLMDKKEILKSILSFDGKKYPIVNFIPSAFYKGDFLLYKMEGVDPDVEA